MNLDIVLSKTQYEFVQSEARHVWLVGPAGEGKTFAAVAAMFAHAQRCLKDNPKHTTAHWCIVRDSHINIERNTIPSIEKAYPNVFQFSKNNSVGIAPGLHVSLFGMDDLQSLNKIQGAEYDGIWIEEPAPILSAGNAGMRHEVFMVCVTRIRGGTTRKRLQIVMNPADEDHWTTKERVRPISSTAIFRIRPGENPHLSDVDRMAVKEAYRHRPDLYARFVEGREARIYPGLAITPEFNDEFHVASKRLAPIAGVQGLRFWDGGLNPTCIVLQLTPMGNLHVLDSVVGEGIGMRQLCENKVVPLLNTPPYRDAATGAPRIRTWRDIGDPSLDNREQSDSEHTAARVIYDTLGGSFERGETLWEPRRDSIKDALSRMVGGQPFFLVSPHTTEGEPFNRVRAALAGGYCYRVAPSGQVLKEGPDKNIHSHPGDALGHGLAKMFTRKTYPLTAVPKAKGVARAASYAVQ